MVSDIVGLLLMGEVICVPSVIPTGCVTGSWRFVVRFCFCFVRPNINFEIKIKIWKIMHNYEHLVKTLMPSAPY